MAVDGNGECAGASRFRATPTGWMEPGGKLYTFTTLVSIPFNVLTYKTTGEL